jgi:hypothetical protein
MTEPHQTTVVATTTQVIIHLNDSSPYNAHGLVVTMKDEGVGEFIFIEHVDGSGEIALDFNMIDALYEALELFRTEHEARKGGKDE